MLYNEDGSVKGVATSNLGIGKDGKPTENFQLGMELYAKYTLFCEGARGHLGRQLSNRFRLRDGADPQVYGIGIKELWEIDPSRRGQCFEFTPYKQLDQVPKRELPWANGQSNHGPRRYSRIILE